MAATQINARYAGGNGKVFGYTKTGEVYFNSPDGQQFQLRFVPANNGKLIRTGDHLPTPPPMPPYRVEEQLLGIIFLATETNFNSEDRQQFKLNFLPANLEKDESGFKVSDHLPTPPPMPWHRVDEQLLTRLIDILSDVDKHLPTPPPFTINIDVRLNIPEEDVNAVPVSHLYH